MLPWLLQRSPKGCCFEAIRIEDFLDSLSFREDWSTDYLTTKMFGVILDCQQNRGELTTGSNLNLNT